MNVETNKKRPIEFEKIHSGTVFKFGEEFYLKTDTGQAVILNTGKLVNPQDGAEPEWKGCYIYPRASVKVSQLQISCEHCGDIFELDESKAWWDHSGFDYDTKLTRCTRCNHLLIIGYGEYPNREDWFYEYMRENNGI